MATRKLRSPLAMVVLGMLAEEPLHPYAMRQRISERAYDRLPAVRTSSLYDTVGRLADAGLIRADDSFRAGNRPERTPYGITSAGFENLTEWVQLALADDDDPDALPAALAFMYPLEQQKVAELLQGRADRLAATIVADEADLDTSAKNGTAPIFLSEHRYQLARRNADVNWIRSFVDDLNAGRIGWPKK